jgi:hypothetical protein
MLVLVGFWYDVLVTVELCARVEVAEVLMPETLKLLLVLRTL